MRYKASAAVVNETFARRFWPVNPQSANDSVRKAAPALLEVVV